MRPEFLSPGGDAVRPIQCGQTWQDRHRRRFTVLDVTRSAVTLSNADGRTAVVPVEEFAAFDTLPSGACAYRFARVLSAAELAEPRGE